MERIDALPNVGEDNQLKMKEEILASEGHLASQIESGKNSVDYLGGNNYSFITTLLEQLFLFRKTLLLLLHLLHHPLVLFLLILNTS